MTTAPSVRPIGYSVMLTTAPTLCEPHIGYSLMLTIDRGHASSIPPPLLDMTDPWTTMRGWEALGD